MKQLRDLSLRAIESEVKEISSPASPRANSPIVKNSFIQPKFHSAQGLHEVEEDFRGEMERDFDWTEERKEVNCFVLPKTTEF